MVTIGIDTHKATLAVCAVDEVGREIAVTTLANDPRGHRGILAWAVSLGPDRRFGIEGSGSFGAALAIHCRRNNPSGISCTFTTGIKTSNFDMFKSFIIAWNPDW